MSLIAKEGGNSNIDPIPQATHSAVCIGVYDIGCQYSEKYKKWDDSVIITWQFPSLRIEIDDEDLPRVLSNTYTVSLDPKANLRKLLESWRGKAFTPAELEGFDISKLLGVPCMIQIIHKKVGEKTYANIGSIMPPLQGAPTVIPEGDTVLFDIKANGPGGAIPETVHDWIQKKIKESKEYTEAVETHIEQSTEGAAAPGKKSEDIEEDVPF